MEGEIINKVALSPLSSLDLEAFYPKGEVSVFDLKPHLFMEMIVKEKEFRASLQTVDWTKFQDKIVAVDCTAEAIIPVWAYMLVATYLQPFAQDIILGNEQTAIRETLLKRIAAIDINEWLDKRVVVKGCGEIPIGEYAYLEITKRLRPVVKSIMYGEPCSTVPVYKKK
jgi:hypothetical protein